MATQSSRVPRALRDSLRASRGGRDATADELRGILHDSEYDEFDDEQVKKLGVLRLLALTCSAGGLQVVWSLVMSHGTPFLITLGLPKSLTAFVWAIAPLSGTLIQPCVGILSDHCQCSSGRRRPFIIVGAVGCVACMLGLASMRTATNITALIWSTNSANAESNPISLIIAVLWILGLNIFIQPFQSGIRSLIVDSCPTHQQQDASAWASRMTGVGSVVGYLFGYLPVASLLPDLDISQFSWLCIVASISLALTTIVTCCATIEPDPRLLPPPGMIGTSLSGKIRFLAWSVKTMPPRVRQVCIIQFFAWLGWFPFLFYISTYVSSLYSEPLLARHPSPTESARIADDAARRGTLANLSFSVVALLTNIMIPQFFTKKPGDGPISPNQHSKIKACWSLSHFLYATAMVFTLIPQTQTSATIIASSVGISWAFTLWVPFSIIGGEIACCHARAVTILPGDEEMEPIKQDQAGAIMGMHNVAISAPQILAAILCGGIFWLCAMLGITDDIGWVLRFGAVGGVTAGLLKLSGSLTALVAIMALTDSLNRLLGIGKPTHEPLQVEVCASPPYDFDHSELIFRRIARREAEDEAASARVTNHNGDSSANVNCKHSRGASLFDIDNSAVHPRITHNVHQSCGSSSVTMNGRSQFRGGMQVHAVPEGERAMGANGQRLPWAYEYADPDRASHLDSREKGPFGRSTRRRTPSRSKGTTPLRKEDKDQAETLRAIDDIFIRGRQETANRELVRSSTTPALGFGTLASPPLGDGSKDKVTPAGTPTEVILYGFGESFQYAAVEFYERASKGTIVEDYARGPSRPRYSNALSLRHPNRSLTLTKEAMRKSNSYRGGNHWIKVTFDSAEAAGTACAASPHVINGYVVHAELYRGDGPAVGDISIRETPGVPSSATASPDARSSSTLRDTSDTASSVTVTHTAPSTLPDPFVVSSSLDARSPQSMSSSRRTHTLPIDNSSVSSSMQLQGRPHRIKGAKRAKLRPASEALIPAKSATQRFIEAVPVLGWFLSGSSDIIGEGLPRKEDGALDLEKAGLYWRFWYNVDWWCGTDFCGLKGDD